MQVKYYKLDGNKYVEMSAKEVNDYLDVLSTFNASEKTHNFSVSLKELNSKYFDIKVVTTLMDGNNVVQDENNQDLTNYFILQAAPSLQTLKFASENYQFAKNETKTIILQATPSESGYTRNLELNVEDLEFAITNLSPRDLEKVTLKTPENCEYKGGRISAFECKVEVSASEALEFGIYADYAHKLESGQASTSLSVVDAPNLNVDRDLIRHGLLVQTKDVQEFEIKTDVNPELFGGLKLSSKKNQDNNYINSTNYNIRYDLGKTEFINGKYVTSVKVYGLLQNKDVTTLVAGLNNTNHKNIEIGVRVVDPIAIVDGNNVDAKVVSDQLTLNLGDKHTYYIKVPYSNNIQSRDFTVSQFNELENVEINRGSGEANSGYRYYRFDLVTQDQLTGDFKDLNIKLNNTHLFGFDYASETKLSINIVENNKIKLVNALNADNGLVTVRANHTGQIRISSDVEFATNKEGQPKINLVSKNSGNFVEITSCKKSENTVVDAHEYICEIKGLNSTERLKEDYVLTGIYKGENKKEYTITSDGFKVLVLDKEATLNAKRYSQEGTNVETINNKKLTYDKGVSVNNIKWEFESFEDSLDAYDVKVDISNNVKDIIDYTNVKPTNGVEAFNFETLNYGEVKVTGTLVDKDGKVVTNKDENDNDVEVKQSFTINVKADSYFDLADQDQKQITMYENTYQRVLVKSNVELDQKTFKLERVASNAPAHASIKNNYCELVKFDQEKDEYTYRCVILANEITDNMTEHRIVASDLAGEETYQTRIDIDVKHRTSYIDVYQNKEIINEQTIKSNVGTKQNFDLTYDAGLESLNGITSKFNVYKVAKDGQETKIKAGDVERYLHIESVQTRSLEIVENYSVTIQNNRDNFDISHYKIEAVLMNGNEELKDKNDQAITNYFNLKAVAKVNAMKFVKDNNTVESNKKSVVELFVDGDDREPLDIENFDLTYTNINTKLTPKMLECNYSRTQKGYICKIEVDGISEKDYGLSATYQFDKKVSATTNLHSRKLHDVKVSQSNVMINPQQEIEVEVTTLNDPAVFNDLKILSLDHNIANNYINDAYANIETKISGVVRHGEGYKATLTIKGLNSTLKAVTINLGHEKFEASAHVNVNVVNKAKIIDRKTNQEVDYSQGAHIMQLGNRERYHIAIPKSIKNVVFNTKHEDPNLINALVRDDITLDKNGRDNEYNLYKFNIDALKVGNTHKLTISADGEFKYGNNNHHDYSTANVMNFEVQEFNKLQPIKEHIVNKNGNIEMYVNQPGELIISSNTKLITDSIKLSAKDVQFKHLEIVENSCQEVEQVTGETQNYLYKCEVKGLKDTNNLAYNYILSADYEGQVTNKGKHLRFTITHELNATVYDAVSYINVYEEIDHVKTNISNKQIERTVNDVSMNEVKWEFDALTEANPNVIVLDAVILDESIISEVETKNRSVKTQYFNFKALKAGTTTVTGYLYNTETKNYIIDENQDKVQAKFDIKVNNDLKINSMTFHNDHYNYLTRSKNNVYLDINMPKGSLHNDVFEQDRLDIVATNALGKKLNVELKECRLVGSQKGQENVRCKIEVEGREAGDYFLKATYNNSAKTTANTQVTLSDKGTEFKVSTKQLDIYADDTVTKTIVVDHDYAPAYYGNAMIDLNKYSSSIIDATISGTMNKGNGKYQNEIKVTAKKAGNLDAATIDIFFSKNHQKESVKEVKVNVWQPISLVESVGSKQEITTEYNSPFLLEVGQENNFYIKTPRFADGNEVTNTLEKIAESMLIKFNVASVGETNNDGYIYYKVSAMTDKVMATEKVSFNTKSKVNIDFTYDRSTSMYLQAVENNYIEVAKDQKELTIYEGQTKTIKVNSSTRLDLNSFKLSDGNDVNIYARLDKQHEVKENSDGTYTYLLDIKAKKVTNNKFVDHVLSAIYTGASKHKFTLKTDLAIKVLHKTSYLEIRDNKDNVIKEEQNFYMNNKVYGKYHFAFDSKHDYDNRHIKVDVSLSNNDVIELSKISNHNEHELKQPLNFKAIGVGQVEITGKLYRKVDGEKEYIKDKQGNYITSSMIVNVYEDIHEDTPIKVENVTAYKGDKKVKVNFSFRASGTTGLEKVLRVRESLDNTSSQIFKANHQTLTFNKVANSEQDGYHQYDASVELDILGVSDETTNIHIFKEVGNNKVNALGKGKLTTYKSASAIDLPTSVEFDVKDKTKTIKAVIDAKNEHADYQNLKVEKAADTRIATATLTKGSATDNSIKIDAKGEGTTKFNVSLQTGRKGKITKTVTVKVPNKHKKNDKVCSAIVRDSKNRIVRRTSCFHNGNLERVTQYAYKGSSKNYSKVIVSQYSYKKDKRLTKRTTYSDYVNNANWRKRLIEVRNDNGANRLNQKRELFRHTNKKTKKSIERKYHGNGRLKVYNFATYNAKGKQTDRRIKEYFASGVLRFDRDYSNYRNGIARKRVFKRFGPNKRRMSQEIARFDNKGRFTSKLTYRYNKKGQLKTNRSGKAWRVKITYRNGKPRKTIRQDYNSRGRLLKARR